MPGTVLGPVRWSKIRFLGFKIPQEKSYAIIRYNRVTGKVLRAQDRFFPADFEMSV